jgi:hypothetical protein
VCALRSPGSLGAGRGIGSAAVVRKIVRDVQTWSVVIDDRAELRRSASRLVDYDFEDLLLCDGDPLATGGKEKLRELVDRSAHG